MTATEPDTTVTGDRRTHARSKTTVAPRAYTPAVAAALLDVGPRTVRRWIQEGHIRATRVGHRLLIPASEIDRLTGTAVEESHVVPGPQTDLATDGNGDCWKRRSGADYFVCTTANLEDRTLRELHRDYPPIVEYALLPARPGG